MWQVYPAGCLLNVSAADRLAPNNDKANYCGGVICTGLPERLFLPEYLRGDFEVESVKVPEHPMPDDDLVVAASVDATVDGILWLFRMERVAGPVTWRVHVGDELVEHIREGARVTVLLIVETISQAYYLYNYPARIVCGWH